MAAAVEIRIKAEGQGLTVDAPPVLATDAVNTVQAIVELSSEWEGMPAKLAVRNCRTGWTYTADIAEGRATVPAAALLEAGYIEVAIFAQTAAKRLTSERVALRLRNSGL